MKKFLIIFCFILLPIITFSQEDGDYIRGKTIKKIESFAPDEYQEEIEQIDLYQIVLKEGEDTGKKIEIQFPIFIESAFNIDLKEGMNVVLYTEIDEEGNRQYYIADIDKRSDMLILAGLFILLTFILARFKGLKAMLALGITVTVIFKLFLPGVIRGYPPILLSVIMAIFASVITIYFMSGFNRKGIVAIIGSIGGVAFAGIISYIFTNKMAITGYSTLDALNYAPMLKGINIKELVSAGVILGSMGAVMDVAMSISSSLCEIKDKNPDIHFTEIFKSGMRIGSDIIGTMVNTLILAYIGSSLFTVMLLVMQKTEFPLVRIFNFEFIAVEILRSFCGSIGILITVPITSYMSSFFHKEENKKGL